MIINNFFNAVICKNYMVHSRNHMAVQDVHLSTQTGQCFIVIQNSADHKVLIDAASCRHSLETWSRLAARPDLLWFWTGKMDPCFFKYSYKNLYDLLLHTIYNYIQVQTKVTLKYLFIVSFNPTAGQSTLPSNTNFDRPNALPDLF